MTFVIEAYILNKKNKIKQFNNNNNSMRRAYAK
jgi:hypothetical protein